MDDKWVRNVRENPAAVAGRQLLDSLNGLEAPDENVASDLAKIRRQVERAVWLFGNCDPYLVPQPALDAAQAHLTAAVEAVTNFQSTQDVAHLGTVMANTDATLVDLGPLVVPGESIAPAESIANLQSTVSEQLAGATAEIATAVDGLKARVKTVDEQRQTAENQSTELAAKLDQLRTEVEALRTSTTRLTNPDERLRSKTQQTGTRL